jgi:membrane-bound serine protease (ClpP class)
MDYLTVAVIFFGIGALLLAGEVLLPTGGFLVVASLLCFALGVGVILYHGDTVEAAVALGGLAIGLPVAGLVAVSAWRRLSLSSGLPDGADTDTLRDGRSETESLKNQVGKTVSPMRPSGSVEIDGRRIDAMTEGVMLDAGVWVRCIEVKGGKVIVRQIEAPGVTDISPDEKPRRETFGGWPSESAPPPRGQSTKPGPTDDLDDIDRSLGR